MLAHLIFVIINTWQGYVRGGNVRNLYRSHKAKMTEFSGLKVASLAGIVCFTVDMTKVCVT
jgi:hypothetical protein